MNQEELEIQVEDGMLPTMKGTDLSPEDQRYVLASYVHRLTGDHRPIWAVQSSWHGKPYPLQFANDREWLEHTTFAVTMKGRLDRSVGRCFSCPTWPNNPELRR